MNPKTMFEKIWDAHVVATPPNQHPIIYIDLHLIHEVTSPQAFEGLKLAGRAVRRPDLTVATVDHAIPTEARRGAYIADEQARVQVEALRANVKRFGVQFYDVQNREQGIVHVIGPEQGYTQPGKTIVCGDSHTSTHGAFGALAFGIGTSEVEHVLATQTLKHKKPQTMRVNYAGELGFGVGAKDIILHTIRAIGVRGGAGSVIEYVGKPIYDLDMEGRMTICNMSIEGGARAGMIKPDDATFEWLEGRQFAPKGKLWDDALERWRALASDAGAKFDREVEIDCSEIAPCVSWGTNPSQVVGIDEKVPDPNDFEDAQERKSAELALNYMDIEPGAPVAEIKIDRVFIGSCTNGRLKDLREAARVVRDRRVAANVRAMVVPGSSLTKYLAEKEGLDKVFKDAGFEWRESGCSMCLGMNPDILAPQERCASTSNRNFEGRQGRGGRTHLVSPAMAAVAAVRGHFDDVRRWS